MEPNYDPTSGLLKDVLETISPPMLEGSERYIIPENLISIGSYNWIEAPDPTILVPGLRMNIFVDHTTILIP